MATPRTPVIEHPAYNLTVADAMATTLAEAVGTAIKENPVSTLAVAVLDDAPIFVASSKTLSAMIVTFAKTVVFALLKRVTVASASTEPRMLKPMFELEAASVVGLL